MMIDAEDEAIRANRIPRIPLGCDRQGRQPQAAEACADIGADRDDLAPATGICNAIWLAGAIVLVGWAGWLVVRLIGALFLETAA